VPISAPLRNCDPGWPKQTQRQLNTSEDAMLRSVVALLSSITACGCIQLPPKPADAGASQLDGSVSQELSSDGAYLRPPSGSPYVGPEGDPVVSASRAPGGGARDGGPSGAPVLRQGGLDAAIASGSGDPGPGALPKTARRPSARGELVITEIMSNPQAVSDDEGEWFELYNPSARETLDLSGCAIDDGGAKPHPIATSLRVAPKAFVTIARTVKAGFTADLLLSFSLGNAADVLALGCDGTEIDRVAYDSSFPLAPGASISLDPSAMDAVLNDRPSAWCLGRDGYSADLGTPGAPNPDCNSRAGADGGTE
jgi:hypothetical protein